VVSEVLVVVLEVSVVGYMAVVLEVVSEVASEVVSEDMEVVLDQVSEDMVLEDMVTVLVSDMVMVLATGMVTGQRLPNRSYVLFTNNLSLDHSFDDLQLDVLFKGRLCKEQ
jgi:hypothetical protein